MFELSCARNCKSLSPRPRLERKLSIVRLVDCPPEGWLLKAPLSVELLNDGCGENDRLNDELPPEPSPDERGGPLKDGIELSPPPMEREDRSPPPPLNEGIDLSPPLNERIERSPPLLKDCDDRSPPLLKERMERSLPPLKERSPPPLKELPPPPPLKERPPPRSPPPLYERPPPRSPPPRSPPPRPSRSAKAVIGISSDATIAASIECLKKCAMHMVQI